MADHSATGDRARQLGATIRRLRTERGWTQQKLGEAAGLDRQTVLRVERALYSPNLFRLFRLADALGVHPAVLFMDDAEARAWVAAQVPDATIYCGTRVDGADCRLPEGHPGACEVESPFMADDDLLAVAEAAGVVRGG